MLIQQLPVESWFINNNEAALSYLKTVIREIGWLETEDTSIRQLSRFLHPKHVKKSSSGGYQFHFEMDRGRPRCGHVYEFVAPGCSIGEFLNRKTQFYRVGSMLSCVEFDGDLLDLQADKVLDAIRDFMIEEILGS